MGIHARHHPGEQIIPHHKLMAQGPGQMEDEERDTDESQRFMRCGGWIKPARPNGQMRPEQGAEQQSWQFDL